MQNAAQLLKEWHDQLGRDPEQLRELWQAQERNDGIVPLCSLDNRLEELLRTMMIDAKAVDELMADGQSLQSFSSKLRLAYALGLLPDTVRRDLQLLNRIRNEFAHNPDVASFDQSPIADLCRRLSTAAKDDRDSISLRGVHMAAIAKNVLFLLHEIVYRENKKPQISSVDSRYVELPYSWAIRSEFAG